MKSGHIPGAARLSTAMAKTDVMIKAAEKIRAHMLSSSAKQAKSALNLQTSEHCCVLRPFKPNGCAIYLYFLKLKADARPVTISASGHVGYSSVESSAHHDWEGMRSQFNLQ